MAGKPTTAAQRYATIPLSSLRPGTLLRSPIYDNDSALLLLSSGTKLTPNLLERLAARGISQVRVDPQEVGRLTGKSAPSAPVAAPPRPPELEQRVAGARWGGRSDSYLHQVAKPATKQFERKRVETFTKVYTTSVNQIDTMFNALSNGSAQSASDMMELSSGALLQIADDLDLFVSLGLAPARDRYPYRHSLNTAMLAMSIGTVLGLTRSELFELALGCLIHDSGMLRVNPAYVNSSKPLGRNEFLEITKHPAITFDMMCKLPDLPAGARMVAYQMHERCDGSGYPRQRSASQIHPLAKIAAVADVFVALVSPRPHRAGMMPYHAMEQILKMASHGQLDSEAVRGLLKTVSLFPLGSYVETNDGRVGRVVRANREHYARPVLELWTPSEPGTVEAVDLASQDQLSITRAISSLAEAACKSASAEPWHDMEATLTEPELLAAVDFWE